MKTTFLLTAVQNGAKRITMGLVVAAAVTFLQQDAKAITTVTFGTASSFAILAGTGISDAGAASTITTGDVGLSPTTGAAITGLTDGQVLNGTIYTVADAGPAGRVINPTLLTSAKNDFGTAYTTAAGETPFILLGVELGSQTLVPGVYRLPDTALLTGILTLNANSVPNPVWIFQATSDLVTASGSSVVFLNDGTPCDVLWQVPTQATLGTDSDFVGTIMAGTTIVMETGATLRGRAWAEAAVTLDHNTITGLPCTSLGGTGGGGGGTTVPDTGSTLLLLGFGLATLLGFSRRFFSVA